MFYSESNDYIYNKFSNVLQDDYIYCPLEADTEYTHAELLDNPKKKFKCTNLTVQVRSIEKDTGGIYAHPNNPYPRHKTFKHGIALLDYLQEQGYEVHLSKCKGLDAQYPIFQFDIYAFFAVAELLRIFQGEYREDVKYLVTNPKLCGIEQGRRLRTYTKCSNKYFNWVEMPEWCLTLNNRVEIKLNPY